MNPLVIFGLGWLVGRSGRSQPSQPDYCYQPPVNIWVNCPRIPPNAERSIRQCPQCYSQGAVKIWRWEEGVWKWQVEKCDHCTFGGYGRCC